MTKSLIKNFIIYGLGFGLSKFSMVLVLPFVTSALSPEEFGKVELVQTAYNVLMIFGLFQMDAALQRFYTNKEFEVEKLINSTLSIVFVGNVVLALIINLVGWFFHSSYGVSFTLVFFVSLLTFFSNITSIIFIVYRYDDRALTLSLLTFIQIATQVLFIYYFLLVEGKGVEHYFVAQLIGFSVLLILQLAFLKRRIYWVLHLGYLKRLVRFGLPQMPARIGAVLNRHIGKFFIIQALSLHFLGIYSAALKVSSLAQVLYMAFNMAWYPMLYSMINDKNYSKLKVMNYLVVFLCLYTTVCFAIISPLLSDLLLGDGYQQATVYMAPLFLTSLLFIVKDSVDIGTRVTEKTYYVSYIYFFTMIITIAMYAMASSYGLIAIVTIQFIGNLLLVTLTLINSEKLFRIGFSYVVNIGLVIIIYALTWLISSYELVYMEMFLVLLAVTLCFVVLMRPLIKDVSVGQFVSNKK